jgi:hypothetical protein
MAKRPKFRPSHTITSYPDRSGGFKSGKDLMFSGDATEYRQSATGKAKEGDIYTWWTQPTAQVGALLEMVIDKIASIQSPRRKNFFRFARLYGNPEALGWGSMNSAMQRQSSGNLPVYNVIQSCIDAAQGKITKDDPKPYFITSGADYATKLKAEKLTQYVDGVFSETNFFDKANNSVFRDAETYGLGAMHWRIRGKKLECEWVFIDELRVDDHDGMKKCPRTIHRAHLVQREQLIADHPDLEDEIMNLPFTKPRGTFRTGETTTASMLVSESYHLAIQVDGEDKPRPGRYVKKVGTQVLIDEPWEADWFPFSFFRWYDKPLGFYGRSITEEIYSAQIEINKALLTIQQSQDLCSVPLVLIDDTSGVAEDVLFSNGVMRGVPYHGGTQPPQFVSPTALQAEYYSHLNNEIAWAFNTVGLSQSSATGQKTAGVNSAVAMRTEVDIESGRLVNVAKNWQKFVLDNAEIVVKLSKMLYKSNPDLAVNYTDKRWKFVKTIPWSKVAVDGDVFIVKCDTVSGFLGTTAERIQTVSEFIARNYISKERGMELLELDPDLRHEIDLQTSPLRYCEQVLSAMIEDGVYPDGGPDPISNLKVNVQIAQGVYLQAKCDGAPEDRLQLVRDFLNASIEMQTANQYQAAYSGGAAPVPPGTPPPAPPGLGNGAPPNGPTPQQATPIQVAA